MKKEKIPKEVQTIINRLSTRWKLVCIFVCKENLEAELKEEPIVRYVVLTKRFKIFRFGNPEFISRYNYDSLSSIADWFTADYRRTHVLYILDKPAFAKFQAMISLALL